MLPPEILDATQNSFVSETYPFAGDSTALSALLGCGCQEAAGGSLRDSNTGISHSLLDVSNPLFEIPPPPKLLVLLDIDIMLVFSDT